MPDDPSLSNDPAQPGDIIGGLYRISRKLGHGGMGTVYLAEQANIGRAVVIKFMRPQIADSPQHAERFKREATLLSLISHPNVVIVYSFGESHGALYLAMEYVEGPTLASLIEDREPLQIGRALDITEQILGALSQAHACGVVHRDLKPENIVLAHTADGIERVKVLDFGIASFNTAAVTALTNEGAVIGTPKYMSPEQINGQPLDGRSDLYSLGLILYEMLSGHHPIRAESPVQFLLGHVSQEIKALSAFPSLSSLPPAIDAFVLKALAKDPNQRFASAPDMLASLQHLRHTYTTQTLDQATTEDADEPFVTTRMTALPTSNTFGSQSSEIERALQNKQTFPDLSPAPPESAPSSHPPTQTSAAGPAPISPGFVIPSASKPRSRFRLLWTSFGVGLSVVLTIWLLLPQPSSAPLTPTSTPSPTHQPPTSAQNQDVTKPVSPSATEPSVAALADMSSDTAPDAEPSPDTSQPPSLAAPAEPKIKRVYAGPHTSYALLRDGRVLAWGNNAQGQLGIEKAHIDSSTPVLVRGLPGSVVDLSVGGSDNPNSPIACAILEDKRVFCWGSGGLIPSAKGELYASPVEAPSLYGAKKISIGTDHGCAITETQELACWGSSGWGALGLGDTPPYTAADAPTPVPLPGPWVDVTAGYGHTCAVNQAKQVYCWGRNSYHRVQPTEVEDKNISSPVKVATWLDEDISVFVSESLSCALLQREGIARCWGERQRAIFVLATQLKFMSFRYQHACVIHTDGRLLCWGYNSQGQLGNGLRAGVSFAFSEAVSPNIPSNSPAVDVSVSYDHTCALLENDQVFCWGNNRFGQLGNGTQRDAPAPVEVSFAAFDKLEDAKPTANTFLPNQPPTAPPGLPPNCTATALEIRDNRLPIDFVWKTYDTSAYSDLSPDTINLRFANYLAPTWPRQIYDAMLEDDQKMRGQRRVFEVQLHQTTPITNYMELGRYAPKDDTSTRLLRDAFWIDRYGAYAHIYGTSPDHSVELTYIDQDWVCGTLKLIYEFGQINGPFAALRRSPPNKKPY